MMSVAIVELRISKSAFNVKDYDTVGYIRSKPSTLAFIALTLSRSKSRGQGPRLASASEKGALCGCGYRFVDKRPEPSEKISATLFIGR
jgi:hypothetical protein